MSKHEAIKVKMTKLSHVTENERSVFTTLDRILRGHGFKKKRKRWYRETLETVSLVDPQKSRWGDTLYYLELGVIIKAMTNIRVPQSFECHIRGRLNSKTTGIEEVNRALDMEDLNYSPADREQTISDAMSKWGLPILHYFSSTAGIKDFLLNKDAKQFLISKVARNCISGLS